MATMMEAVIQGLTLLGVVLLSWFAMRLASKTRRERGQNPPEGRHDGPLRGAVRERAKVQQKGIQEALTGQDPATALADLGNKRRQ